jgi:hypothetical protein
VDSGCLFSILLPDECHTGFVNEDWEDEWAELKLYEGDIILGISSGQTDMVNTKRFTPAKCEDTLRKLAQEKRPLTINRRRVRHDELVVSYTARDVGDNSNKLYLHIQEAKDLRPPQVLRDEHRILILIN